MNNSAPDNHSPLKFFLLVFGLSIPLWIIETRIDVKGLPLDIPITDILAAFTPTIAASILVYKEEGLIGVKKLFKRILDFPRITQKIWYGCAVSLPCLVYVLIYIIIYLLGLPLPFNFHIPFLSIPFLFCLFFLGASAEETGYMGYAIDTIQERFSALPAGILICTVLLAITAIAITWLWGTETLSKYRFLEQSASKGVA